MGGVWEERGFRGLGSFGRGLIVGFNLCSA